ncbi:dihydroorotase [Haloarchaeobius iranensis]|uniref:Dihydropyrimidinase/dihydroorotase n=1 Tax=Haloarchaeobius iranensis TaxID=996166 RepID=A0A1G9UZ22_9EURY|nr:amidohydrolase family protein [Haloarchaeobius iranensis]SDM65079.1 dihydropyrimidinase/dihydroorotase [Haloarchaeobius iranensis]
MARADLCIHDARVVTPSGTIHGGVASTDGTITAVGGDGSLPDADRTIDAGGNYLVPGFIDPHVHWGLSRYEFEYHEGLEHDFETETRGAVHGGVTTVVNFLLQPEPYLPDMEFFRRAGEENSYIDFAYHAIIHKDHHFEEVDGLAEEGVRSFKIFFNWYKHAAPELGIEHSHAGRVYDLLSQVADIPGGVVMFHAENEDIAYERRQELQEEGRNDLGAWSESAPNICEFMQIEQIGHMTELTDSRAYIVHMSTGEGVDICKCFQERGVNLHAETLPAFLTHTKDEEELGVWGKISPPLRGEWSKDRLWQGLREGTVDYLGTDHCPHKIEFKEKDTGKHGDIWDAIPGDNNGIEYFLPVLLSEGVNRNRISMERLVEICAENNAKRWGLYPRKGALVEGSDADMVVVDMEKSKVVDDDFYHTMEPRYSTMHGMELTGLPTHTVVGGEVVVEHDELQVEPGGRHYLHRGDSGVELE